MAQALACDLLELRKCGGGEEISKDFAEIHASAREFDGSALAETDAMASLLAFDGAGYAEEWIGLAVVRPAGFFEAFRVAAAVGGVESGDYFALVCERESTGVERGLVPDGANRGCSAKVLAMSGVTEVVALMSAVRGCEVRTRCDGLSIAGFSRGTGGFAFDD